MDQKFFKTPFATSGSRSTIPEPVQPGGEVSYTEGYGTDYGLVLTNPSAKRIERDKFNELIYETQNSLAALQVFPYPEFITSSDNGGSPYSYAKQARVRFTGDSGSTWAVFESLTDGNTTTPNFPYTSSATWVLVPTAGTATIPEASAGGTANAITATFAPALTTLAQDVIVGVRCAAANTGAGTFNPNGLGAKAIYVGNNQALTGGEIPGAGFWALLQRDQTLDKWQLLNPYTSGIALPLAIGSGGTGKTTAYEGLDALTVQGANKASASTTDLSTTTGHYVKITGTTTINGFGTMAAGVQRTLEFTNSLTLTNSGTLICLGGANITTAAGDTCIMMSEGSGTWRMISYFQAASNPTYGVWKSLTPQAYAANTTLTFAHGLGVEPSSWQIKLVCTTNDAGYTAGEVIGMDAAIYDGSNKGYTVVVDATNIVIRIGSNGLSVINGGSHASANLTDSFWNIKPMVVL